MNLSRETRKRILVVDDDLDARRIYGTYLRAMGCRVRTASNGLTAIQSASRYPPDAIVMDLAMPVLDGWSTIRRLRRKALTQSIPIVVVSCVQSARAAARAAGCDAFLAKPCPPELLWWQLRAVFTVRRSAAEARSAPRRRRRHTAATLTAAGGTKVHAVSAKRLRQ